MFLSRSKVFVWILLSFASFALAEDTRNVCDNYGDGSVTASSDSCLGVDQYPNANNDVDESNQVNNIDTMHRNAEDLVRFLKSFQGGYFNDKLEIRKTDKGSRGDGDRLGIFALQDIPAEELLLEFPPESRIRVRPSRDGDWLLDACNLAKRLLKEIALGEESDFFVYLNYLKSTKMSELSRFPSTWSSDGKNLLSAMLLQDDWESEKDDYTSLPPNNPSNYHNVQSFCFEDGDDIKGEDEKQFTLAVAMRYGFDFTMIPIYDIINHSNDRNRINIMNSSTRAKGEIKVKASTDVAKGQEILHSFDRCIDCDDIEEEWGTPELFRDFGFIEEYPQRYHFIGGHGLEDISFDVIQDGGDDRNKLTVQWLYNKQPFSVGAGMRFMEYQLQRLETFKNQELMPAKGYIPDQEWELIWEYHQALTTALSLAIEKAQEDYFEEDDDDDVEKDDEELELEFVLPEETSVISKLDQYRRFIYQAETLVWAADHFDEFDLLYSEYQRIQYYQEPNTGDTCFYLDTIFQMCGSYWPYYHEMQVHKPAKYIKEDIKRVLFVGAGDSGLLNEIVKYPNLELVVGLELDQHVTRMAFKHLGARPHYDDERVQWWYGDASKTLLMLPKEYFGSFDMVLVDLSDTIFALSVSGELDVIGALSLLLRPGGIFAMNELFFTRVSNTFQYAIHFQFHNVPKIMDQAFVFASHDVDFLKQDLTDHRIANLLVEDSLLATTHPFEFVHDYRRNPNPKSSEICKNTTVEENDSLSQDTSPGIFMVLEVEQIHWKHLGSITHVQNAVEKALKKRGLNLLSGKDKVLSSDSSFVLVLKEGYVSVHVFPEGKFCAFDILLWSSFDKFQDVKRSLIKAVGGRIESTSSYRIVTGGMFGVSTWKEDRKSHGPQLTELCSDTDDDLTSKEVTSPSPEDVYSIALLGSLDLVHDADEYYVAVLCGEKSESCGSFDVLENKNKNITVVPVYACSGDKASPESPGCTLASAKETLMKSLESKIRVVVIDKSASQIMGEVILMMHENDMLEENLLAIAMIDSRRDLWRRQAIDRVRRRIRRMDPVFRAHVLFNSEESSMELALVSSGDVRFFENLKDLVAEIETHYDYKLEIRNIIGGIWREEMIWTVEDEDMMPLFYPSSFDHSAALKQWNSQRPLMIQGVEQYTNGAKFVVNDKVEVLVEDDEYVPALIAVVNDDGSYGVVNSLGSGKNVSRQQVKAADGPESSQDLVSEEVKEAFDRVVRSVMDEAVSAQLYDEVGDGCVQVAVWNSTTVVLVWDGKSQVDLNVFSDSISTIEVFGSTLQKNLNHLVLKLRDVQPRGHGRVVNFESDVLEYPTPHWMENYE